MTYKGPHWDWSVSYWFNSAEKTMCRPLWPRKCDLTEKTLWLKPAVRGKTVYAMRSGSRRYDIRWADPRALVELGLKGRL